MPPRDLPYPCLIVRHRGARRMTLRVSRAGVRLTVPRGARAAEIERLLLASEGWVAEQTARLGPAPAPLADGDRVALLDEQLALAVVAGARRSAVCRDGARLVVSLSPAGDVDAAVERWYRRRAAAVLDGRSRALAARLGVEVTGVAVRDPRSRWGSCASAGRLSFSWRLVLAPQDVLDYVVAHEVCHLLRPDHSPAYWALLREVMPGFAAPRAWLRERGDALHLGPAWRSRS